MKKDWKRTTYHKGNMIVFDRKGKDVLPFIRKSYYVGYEKEYGKIVYVKLRNKHGVRIGNPIVKNKKVVRREDIRKNFSTKKKALRYINSYIKKH